MIHRIPTAIAIICMSALAALAQSASTSGRSIAYSETSGKTCKTLRNDGEWADWTCKGVGRDVSLVNAITRAGAIFGKDGENEPPYSPDQPFIGKKIEWRLQDGHPYATIYRAYVSIEVPKPGRLDYITKQVLVVTKLDGENACHMAYVDASIKGANAKAAEVADANAVSFKCGLDKPQRIGNPAAFMD